MRHGPSWICLLRAVACLGRPALWPGSSCHPRGRPRCPPPWAARGRRMLAAWMATLPGGGGGHAHSLSEKPTNNTLACFQGLSRRKHPISYRISVYRTPRTLRIATCPQAPPHPGLCPLQQPVPNHPLASNLLIPAAVAGAAARSAAHACLASQAAPQILACV